MKTLLLLASAALLLLDCASIFAQGSLTPPALPAPTMKTLTQIEPRIEISATNTPGDSSSVFKITQPGSYYLGSNVTGVNGKHGILVAAPHVTLDLNGFVLQGVAGSFHGISGTSASLNLTIRNGVIDGFSGDGIRATQDSSLIEGVHVSNNGLADGSYGMRVGSNAVVRGCVARGNGGTGISVASGAVVGSSAFDNGQSPSILGNGIETVVAATTVGLVVSNCEASNNDGNGFSALSGGLIAMNCTASGNTFRGFRAITGADAAASVLTNCTATQNGSGGFVTEDATLQNCAASDNEVIGFHGGRGSSLSGCTAIANVGDGIVADEGSTLTSCTVTDNLVDGIRVGAGSTIANCNAFNNGVDGIHAGTGSTLSGCTARQNNRHGIQAADQATIQNCTVSENTGDGISTQSAAAIEACTARANNANGILVTDACLISNCVVNRNGKHPDFAVNATSDGIQMGARNRVLNCTLFDNAQYGLNSTSANNRNFIEGCLVHTNGAGGIALAGSGNTVIKNQVGGNSGFAINQSGGNIAPVQNASDPVGSIHPLANFQ